MLIGCREIYRHPALGRSAQYDLDRSGGTLSHGVGALLEVDGYLRVIVVRDGDEVARIVLLQFLGEAEDPSVLVVVGALGRALGALGVGALQPALARFPARVRVVAASPVQGQLLGGVPAGAGEGDRGGAPFVDEVRVCRHCEEGAPRGRIVDLDFGCTEASRLMA